MKLFVSSSAWSDLEYLCIHSQKSIPVFHLDHERRDLALQITVNNVNGDDAYEAKVVGTFPEMLSYSRVRTHHTTVNKGDSCASDPVWV